MADELNCESERIDRPHCLAEPERCPGRNALGWTAAISKESLGPVEVVWRADPESHPSTRRLRPFTQHDAVMHELLVAAQIQHARLFGLNVKADQVDPPCAGTFEVRYDKVDVRRSNVSGGSFTSSPVGWCYRWCQTPSVTSESVADPWLLACADEFAEQLGEGDAFGGGEGGCPLAFTSVVLEEHLLDSRSAVKRE